MKPAFSSPHIPQTRLPLLLGAVGFDQVEYDGLARRVGNAGTGGVPWSVGDFDMPDAWLVNGSRARLCSPEEIEVGPMSGAPPIRFALRDVDRPIAFTTPLATPDFEPACTFDAGSTDSTMMLLAKLAKWLRPRAMLLSLGALIATRRRQLERGRVYQVHAKDKLVAVVNIDGESGVLPSATWSELEDGSWAARPASAAYIPASFQREATRALLWQYATRCACDLLPARYRVSPIHLRSLPQVPQRLLTDAQLNMLRELAHGSRSLRQLADATGLSPVNTCRELAALYVVGSITTSERKASSMHRDSGGSSSWPASSALMMDATAPGVMRMPRSARATPSHS